MKDRLFNQLQVCFLLPVFLLCGCEERQELLDRSTSPDGTTTIFLYAVNTGEWRARIVILNNETYETKEFDIDNRVYDAKIDMKGEYCELEWKKGDVYIYGSGEITSKERGDPTKVITRP